MKTMELKIDGMSCGHCVAAVKKALSEVPGVHVESVRIGGATVQVDETRDAMGSIVDAVADAGYSAEEAVA